jgi:hypothetical protein
VTQRYIKQEINFRSKFLLTIQEFTPTYVFPHTVMIVFAHLIALSHAVHNRRHHHHHHHLFVIYLTVVSLRLQAYTLGQNNNWIIKGKERRKNRNLPMWKYYSETWKDEARKSKEEPT